jgi:hypothetical protein
MMRRLRHHLSYANVVATVALTLSMSGAAWAAGTYLITSTSQISPKVLKKLKGHKGAAGAAGPEGLQGPTGAAGPAGAQGVQGTTGPVGDEGRQGSVGATGPPGPVGIEGPAGLSQNAVAAAAELSPAPGEHTEVELTELRGAIKLRLVCGEGPRADSTSAVVEATGPTGASAETGIVAYSPAGSQLEETERLIKSLELTEGFAPVAELDDDTELEGSERRSPEEQVVQGELNGALSTSSQANFLDMFIEVKPYGSTPVCAVHGAVYGSPVS